MATFMQWKTAGKFKKLTFLCGSEAVLIEEIVDAFKAEIRSAKLNRATFIAGVDDEDDIWAFIYQYSLDLQDTKLVVVREAQNLVNWKMLEVLFSAKTSFESSLYLLFISSESHVYEELAGKPRLGEDGKKQIKSHIQFIRSKTYGDVVVCVPLNPDPVLDEKKRFKRSSDFVLWINSHVEVSDQDADYLLNRCGRNMFKVRDVIQKAKYDRGHLNKTIIDLLCTEDSVHDFSFYLISVQRGKALKALETMSFEEHSLVLGHLDYLLVILGKLHKTLRENIPISAIIRTENLPGFVVKLYLEHAKHYDKAKVIRCRKTLASADDMLTDASKLNTVQVDDLYFLPLSLLISQW